MELLLLKVYIINSVGNYGYVFKLYDLVNFFSWLGYFFEDLNLLLVLVNSDFYKV